jgi:hypothetical protein
MREDGDGDDVEMEVAAGRGSTGTQSHGIVSAANGRPTRRRSRSSSSSASDGSAGGRRRRTSRSRSAERGTMPLLSPIPFLVRRSPPLGSGGGGSGGGNGGGEPENLALSSPSSSPPPLSTGDLPPTSPRRKDTLPLDGIPPGPVDELDLPAESRSSGLVRDGKGVVDTADEPVSLTSAGGDAGGGGAGGSGSGDGAGTTSGLGLALEDRFVSAPTSATTEQSGEMDVVVEEGDDEKDAKAVEATLSSERRTRSEGGDEGGGDTEIG